MFLDNIIKGASNEELYRASRAPAGNFVVEETQPQKEIVIEADAKVRPIEFSPSYKMESKQTPDYVENVNRAIEQRQGDKEANALNAKESYNKQIKNELKLGNIVNQAMEAKNPYKRSPEMQKALDAARLQSENLQKAPERDLASEMILSFAPAAFGIFGGESAALSQVEGGKKARDLYEARRKEQAESTKSQNEQILKKYEQLVKIDSALADDWLAKQKLDTEQTRLGADILKFSVGTSQKDVQKAEELANKASQDVLTSTIKTSGEAAKMEAEPEKEKQKTIRAGIAAANKPATEGERKSAFQFNQMAQAEQNIKDIVSKNKGYPSLNSSFYRTQRDIISGKYSGITMNDFLNKFVDNKALRAQAQAELQFLESIGRIQSGAAISPSEWASMREQYFPTYGDSADSIAIKEQQRVQALEGIKTMAGRAQTNQPKSVISKETLETKTINGVTYKKVKDGWQRVK